MFTPGTWGKVLGSFNFGVVPHMGIPGMYLQTHNRNVLVSRVERDQLRGCLWRRLRPQLEALRQCRDIPPLTVDGVALPWNGEQLNLWRRTGISSNFKNKSKLIRLWEPVGARGGACGADASGARTRRRVL